MPLDRLEQLYNRYLDEQLRPEEDAELTRLLQDPANQQQWRILSLLDAGLLEELKIGRCEETCVRDCPRTGRRPAVWQARPGARARRAHVWLAVAAGVALAVAGGLWLYPRLAGAPALGLRVAVVTGQATVTRAGRAGPVNPGLALRDGDRVTVTAGGTAALQYEHEQTRIELLAATAVFRSVNGAKRLRLESGLLRCTAAPQQQPFQLATPHAVAEVVGTRFSLDVAPTTTTLAVQEGKVSLSQGAKTLAVGAGETAVALPQALNKAAAAGPEPPPASGRIRLNFDFEDGVKGPEWAGRLLPGPPRPSNRYCMEAETWVRGIRRVMLRDTAHSLFTYRPGMAIAFDYWAGEDVDAIDTICWDRTQQEGLGCEPIYQPARGQWTHVRRDLQEFTGRNELRLKDGSLVNDLSIQTNTDGGQLFVDNVVIETLDPGAAPGKGGRK